jgi:hypothetical protein
MDRIDRHARAKIRANIFPPAHSAALELADADWHNHADRPNSSQALAISVFGTVEASSERDNILNRVADRIGLPRASDWTIKLEWWDESNALKEKSPTLVDAVAVNTSADTMILFECKFTEGGGACSQLKNAKCDGRNPGPLDPTASVPHACPLSRKGIKYWSYVSAIFDTATLAGSICPFGDERYQWMRNLTLGAALKADRGINTGLVAVYVDRPKLYMREKIVSEGWPKTLGLRADNSIPMITLSYQDIVQFALDAVRTSGSSPHTWRDLSAWIETRIAAATVR